MAGKTGSDIGERVADVNEGDAGSLINDQGLTAEEQAQFDAMRTGADLPDAGDGAAGDDGDVLDTDAGDGVDGDAADAGTADGDADDTRDGVARDGEIIPPADQQRQPKTVSFGKYQRELKAARERADKAAQAERAATEKATRLDERTKLLLDAINTKAAPAAPRVEPEDVEPDAEEDPFGHNAWTRRELGRTQQQLKDLVTRLDGNEKQTAARTEESDLLGRFNADIEQEIRADASFSDAIVYLRDSRYRELGFIYADIDIMDPKQCETLSADQQIALSNKIQASWNSEQMLTARNAFGANKRPANIVKSLARARGFDPDRAAAARADAAAAGNGERRPAPSANGRAAPARPQQQRRSVSEEVEAIKAGSENGRSLSDASGSPGSGYTMEAISNMSEEEFSDLYATVSGQKKVNALLGK